MKKLFFSALCMSVLCITQAQTDSTTNWTSGGEGLLSFSSTGFGDYYSGGGLNSTTVGGLVNLFGDKSYSNNASWSNALRVDYGVAKVQNTNFDNFTKASDVLDFISKYSTPVGSSDKWNYSAAFNFLSQLTDTKTSYITDPAAAGYSPEGAFNPLVGLDLAPNYGENQSKFLSPADLVLGLGFDYKPNENFSAFIGPLSGKLRVINDDLIAASQLFGNEAGENTRKEFGASAIAGYNNKFLDNDMLGFTTGLKLFSDYTTSPENVDVNWNTITTLNPWKFITLSYSTDVAYDDNKTFTLFADGNSTGGLDKGIQFRNVLGIGLTHKFGDAKPE